MNDTHKQWVHVPHTLVVQVNSWKDLTVNTKEKNRTYTQICTFLTWSKPNTIVWTVTDPLYYRECLLICCNLFPNVPRDSGHVVTLWLEYVRGHVSQVDTWQQHTTENKWNIKTTCMWNTSLLSFFLVFFNLYIMARVPVTVNRNILFLCLVMIIGYF